MVCVGAFQFLHAKKNKGRDRTAPKATVGKILVQTYDFLSVRNNPTAVTQVNASEFTCCPRKSACVCG